MKKVCIVQTRMGSTRLPGKVMKDLCGKPVIFHVIERLKRCKNIDQIIVATTREEKDDIIATFVAELEDPLITVFRGSEDDVLSRFYEAALQARADLVIRITSDCPLIDPALVDQVIERGVKSQNYTSNIGIRSFPRGLDTEVFPFSLLEKAHLNAKKTYEREHVTPFIRENAADHVTNVAGPKDYSEHRWTLDTEEDYQLIKKIYSAIYPKNPEFTWKDVLELFNVRPELFLINAHVEQKTISK